MYFREMIFGQEPYIPQRGRAKSWIKILLIAALVAIAWHYGIIAWGFRITVEIARAIFNMAADLLSFGIAFQKNLQQALTSRL